MSAGTARSPGRPPFPGMVWIPAGGFRMGSDHHYPEEAPAHDVEVAGFWIDRTPVTNAQFRSFVKATGINCFCSASGPAGAWKPLPLVAISCRSKLASSGGTGQLD